MTRANRAFIYLSDISVFMALAAVLNANIMLAIPLAIVGTFVAGIITGAVNSAARSNNKGLAIIMLILTILGCVGASLYWVYS